MVREHAMGASAGRSLLVLGVPLQAVGCVRSAPDRSVANHFRVSVIATGQREAQRASKHRAQPKSARPQEEQDSYRKRTAQRNSHYFASAATCIWTILSGLGGGSPFFSLSTTSMPCTTSPITVYLPFRNGPSANMMKN